MNKRLCGFLFPGQGSQFVGMGVDLCSKYSDARKFLADAGNLVGMDILEIMSTGSAEELKETRVAQIAIFLYSLLMSQRVSTEKNIHCCAVAGHSLGEVTALAYAGVLSFADALLLIDKRALAMQAACCSRPGTMAAIINIDPLVLPALCDIVQGDVCIANYNSLNQLVISGECGAVEEVARLAVLKGAKMAIPLNVAGAFHSPLMADAALLVKNFIETLTFKDPLFPIYQNLDGKSSFNAFEIKKKLIEHILSPVLWTSVIQNMQIDGVELFFEPGPGIVLTKLTNQIVGKECFV